MYSAKKEADFFFCWKNTVLHFKKVKQNRKLLFFFFFFVTFGPLKFCYFHYLSKTYLPFVFSYFMVFSSIFRFLCLSQTRYFQNSEYSIIRIERILETKNCIDVIFRCWRKKKKKKYKTRAMPKICNVYVRYYWNETLFLKTI